MAPAEDMEHRAGTRRRRGKQELDAWLSEWAFTTIGRRMPRRVLLWLEHSGNGLIWIPVATAAAFGFRGIPSIINIWSANLLLALIIDLVAVALLKGLVRRPRPSYNDSTDFLTVATVDSFSFPSGHTSRVAMLSGLAIVCLLPNSPVVVALSLLWAVTVAASRVFLGRHYVSDVLGGVLLGVTVTAAITQGTFSEEGLAINKHVLSNAMAKLLRTWNH